MQNFIKIASLLFLWVSALQVSAQVSITALDSTNAYTQDFNSFSTTANTTWVNNSTLPNWYVQAGKTTPTTLVASAGTSAAGNLYNFGSSGSTDRALGAITNAAMDKLYYGVRMKNNTGVPIRAFSITFTGEQWRHSKESAQKLVFSYKTSTGAITVLKDGGWQNVNTLQFTGPVKGGKPAAMNGNLAANRRLKSYTITNVNLAPGSEIMFRWYDEDKGGDDHALAIDDVTIVPFNPIDFYSQPSGNLNDLNTWGTNTDGSGMKPLNFTNPYQIFHIRNSATKSISKDWIIKGFGSKAIIDDAATLNFTIPNSDFMKGNIDIMEKGILTINNQIAPSIGFIDINTTVVYGNNKGNQNIVPADYYNLTVTGGYDKILTDVITVNGALTFSGSYINAGNFDLAMATNTTITGANATNYVKTTGTGSLVREVLNGATVAFPVGTTTSYNPAVVKNTSETNNYSASVSPKLYSSYDENYVANGGEITSKVVSRAWLITPETDSASTATIQLQWNANEELPELNRSLVNVSYFGNNLWTPTANAAATGTNPYTRTSPEVNAFGLFAVTGMNADLKQTPLPVVLISFKATAIGSQVHLHWVTASEKNNDKFVLEKSLNGTDWTLVGEVKGNGTTNQTQQYGFIDQLAETNLNRIYYRVKQVDFDGTFKYSKIAVVTFSRTKEIAVTPVANHVHDKVQFNLNGNVLNQATLQIYSASGMLVISQNLTESKALNGIDISYLTPGVYIYRIADQQQFLGSGKFIKNN